MALAACGGPSTTGSGSGGGTGGGGQAADANGVHNPSDATGGTIRMANSGDWDSLDPADTYYAYSWNFVRLYGRSLMMFKSAPGAEGATLVPGPRGERWARPNADSTQWTYTLRQGVKFEDGTPVTSKDVKYAVERSLDKTTFPNGPTYFNDFLDLQGYTSPYQDPEPGQAGPDRDRHPGRPDDRVQADQAVQRVRLLRPAPGDDPGAAGQGHRVRSTRSTWSPPGPYMFETNDLGKSFAMVRNPNWDQATDPNRKPLPDRIEVALNVNADDIDNRLHRRRPRRRRSRASGVGPAAQGRILADQNLKANTDNAAASPGSWFTDVNGEVAPLDNIHCRKAVQYAADRTGYQRAYGGATGGDIATNLMPPVIPGAEQFDLYPSAGNTGDLDKARDELNQCGQPNGFTTGISYRAERPKEKATAEALQQSLARVGINLEIKPYPLVDYLKLYAGKPDFAKANNLGLIVYGWGADWPDGFGFLSQIVDSRVIRATGGNSNLSVRDPEVDALVDKAVTTADTAAREKIVGGRRPEGDGGRVHPAGHLGQGPALPAAEPDERVHHQRVPDVRLPGAGHDAKVEVKAWAAPR